MQDGECMYKKKIDRVKGYLLAFSHSTPPGVLILLKPVAIITSKERARPSRYELFHARLRETKFFC